MPDPIMTTNKREKDEQAFANHVSAVLFFSSRSIAHGGGGVPRGDVMRGYVSHDLLRRRAPDDRPRALGAAELRLHLQFLISGMSSPCLSMYCLSSISLSRIARWA